MTPQSRSIYTEEEEEIMEDPTISLGAMDEENEERERERESLMGWRVYLRCSMT